MMRLIVLAVFVVVLAVIAPRYLARLVETPAEPGSTVAVAVERPPAALDTRVVLRADAAGHYAVDAVINGRSVPVLVDTGATTVAISTETARRLGISVANSAFTVEVVTANGRIRAAPVVLREVRIGEVRVRDVAALVLPADALGTSLLGMTFLNRLRKFESAGNSMTLTQ